MIMLTIKLSIPRDVFAAVRELPTRTKRNFNRELQTTVKPALQKDVDALLKDEPPRTGRTFEFSTPESRRYYFAAFKGRIPYQRKHKLVKGWFVDIPRTSEKSYIVIGNSSPIAQYVYGSVNPYQRQVPGHARTGWGRNNRVAFALITEHGIELIIDAWGRAVYQAARER
jgi:hypothetical protein